MKGWHMYSKIQAMKEQGFSIRQVAKINKTSRNTIAKYWNMEPEEYAATYKSANRMTPLKSYEGVVLKWLEAYPCMTSAQVWDWLAERYKFDASDRTVRKFVADIRIRHGILKGSAPKRDYEAVEELPMGYQLQLDFGEKAVRRAHSNRYIKLYFVVFTLSYSRYKWGKFQDRPFLSEDLVHALYSCFSYYGGKPKQIVYDQDSIIVVSENGGDIIHTKAFASFLAESKLEVRVCRKSDPESKGIIEASVKYVKGNYMENRPYASLEAWAKSFEEWLVRTGNKKEHGTTKRRPAEMFEEEQVHLLPLYGVKPIEITEEMDRLVRPDNTVWYRSNRYSVPYGTYNIDREVDLRVEDGKLWITNRHGELLGEHEINPAKGKLIKLDSHRRKKGEKDAELREKAIALLGEEFREYLEDLSEKMPRYIKDQLKIAIKACETYGRDIVLTALRYCQELELYSANDLRDAADMISGSIPAQPTRLRIEGERYHIPVQKRALSIYTDVAAGSGVAR